MRRVTFGIVVACAALLVGTSAARAFVGGSGTDSSTLLLPGFCSVSGAPCGPGFGACPAPPETCLGFTYSGSFTQDGTSGESSAVQSAFYECKQKSKTPAVKTSEDTLLVLVNEHASTTLCACVVLFDGHGAAIAKGVTTLSGMDVDEINLCSLVGTIPAGGFTGSVEVVTVTGACPYTGSLQGGAYGWIKDVAYKGTKKDAVNPFSAAVQGLGKTELRVTPAGVESGSSYAAACAAAPLIPSTAYAENTYE
jgi:hypothetical protein